MLTKANLELAKLLTTKDADNSKFVIGGILVTPTETVATNGHWMAIITASKDKAEMFPVAQEFQALDEFTPFVLPRKAAVDILKTLPTDTEAGKLPVLKLIAVAQSPTDAKPHAVLYTTDLDTNKVFQARTIAGQFPNWRVVVPDPTKATTQLKVSVEYMDRIFHELKAMGVEYVTLRAIDSDSAIRFDGKLKDTEQNVTIILMPVRLAPEDEANAPTYKLEDPKPVAETTVAAAEHTPHGDAFAALETAVAEEAPFETVEVGA